ncbi:phospholipase D family protein [Bradyrhizobium barranii subsp. apii]|uniref:Phospholipase D family protein n=1 Tax=Bradyrhizobium barranii subsp. apii TaxID=2819348 RepID=A0A8T5VM00_9BRAD|nr:phospholipase D family protein [Bradyrhizobium barranii]UPT89820.1 phospholipase D family protein [Bradyrhizobium barranii subsp. apii]
MQVSLLDAKSTARRLSALIQKHNRISIAVAWGGIMSVADTLLANRAKFEFVLPGVDFSATDPDLIDRLVDIPNAFVARNRPGCFHPKIFYFQTGTNAEAIVGSANFTKGGLGPNLEAGVHVRGAAEDSFFEQIRNQLDRYKPLCLPIAQPLADSYRRQSRAAGGSPRPNNPVLPGERRHWKRFNSPLAIMSWKEFAKQARQDLFHDYKKRLKLVRAIQQLFAKTPSFADLSTAEAKGVAGVLGHVEAEGAGLNDLDWGWFGTMGGAGTFAKLIGRENLTLAAALDAIPKRGNVTEAQFNDYVATFTAAFSQSSRTARLAPATRLLAMKRPDFFVCVNGGNMAGLADALAFARTTIKLENYWERVIEPIQQAPWYNASRPTGWEMELWDIRVAMLDAIYYQPLKGDAG